MSQPQASKQKLDSIQALRGIAILLVLIIHAKTYEAFHRGDLLPAEMFVGNSGVDLFFCISGFIMVIINRGKFGLGWSETKKFLARRFCRIYPLYWAVTAAAFLVHYFFSNKLFGTRSFDWLSTGLLIPTLNQPLVMQAWSLMNELYFYVVFGFFLFCSERWLPWLLLSWLAVVLAIGFPPTVVAKLSPYPILSLITHPMTIEFIAGCFLALYLPRLKRVHGVWIFALGWILFAYTVLYHSAPNPQSRVLFFGLPCFLIFSGAVLSEMHHSWRFPRLLIWIGDWSYSIYLIHILAYGVATRLWPSSIPKNIPLNCLYSLWLVVFAIATGAASYRILEKPMLNFFHKLIGR